VQVGQVVLARDLLRRQAVEVATDDQRHDANRRRCRGRRAQLLREREGAGKICGPVLNEGRGHHAGGVADTGDPEPPPTKLVGDIVGKAGAVGAVQYPDVHR